MRLTRIWLISSHLAKHASHLLNRTHYHLDSIASLIGKSVALQFNNVTCYVLLNVLTHVLMRTISPMVWQALPWLLMHDLYGLILEEIAPSKLELSLHWQISKPQWRSLCLLWHPKNHYVWNMQQMYSNYYIIYHALCWLVLIYF